MAFSLAPCAQAISPIVPQGSTPAPSEIVCNEIVSRVQALSGGIHTQEAQKFLPLVQKAIKAIGCLYETLSDSERQQLIQNISARIEKKMQEQLSGAGEASFQALQARQEVEFCLREKALQQAFTSPELVALMEKADLAVIQAAFGINSAQESVGIQYWSMVKTSLRGYLSYKKVSEHNQSSINSFVESVLDQQQLLLVSSAPRGKSLSMQQKLVADIDALEQATYATLLKKKEGLSSENEQLEISYSLVQVQASLPSMSKQMKRTRLEEASAELKRDIERLRPMQKRIFEFVLGNAQDDLMRVKNTFHKKMQNELETIAVHIQKIQQQIHSWDPSYLPITQAGLSSRLQGMINMKEKRIRALQGDQSADADLLQYYADDSRDISTYMRLVATSQYSVDHLDSEMCRLYGSPDEILALIPGQTEYDKAIMELSTTQTFYTSERKEPLTVEGLLENLKTDLEKKIATFSELANKGATVF